MNCGASKYPDAEKKKGKKTRKGKHIQFLGG